MHRGGMLPANGREGCGTCLGSACRLSKQLISEFNALGIEDMAEVTCLNALKGSYINLEYTLPEWAERQTA